MRRKRLGDLLVENGMISRSQLETIIGEVSSRGSRLGENLVERGLATEEGIGQALATQLSMPYYPLDSEELDPKVVRLIPRALASKFGMLAVELEGSVLVVAMIDPLDVRAFDTLRAQLGYQIRPAVAPKKAILKCIQTYYDMAGVLDETISKATSEQAARSLEVEDILDETEAEGGDVSEVGAPVVTMVNTLLQRAVESEASDIHIEPEEDETHVRFRNDGTLRHILNIPKNLHDAVVSRVKIMSRLDISERRRPQDGRAKMRILGRPIDFRISVLPTLLGEKVVIRILDKEQAVRKMDDLGMLQTERAPLEQALQRTRGIILVTGPTGSGKTTTLYAALQSIREESRNLLTIEDPVEYRLQGVNQIQINPKAGLTFASGLRSMLRQDPDIILVGEIRDRETAEIAIQAALTGHLVLSTLHTNDAPSAVTRLMDMGIEPFLISATVTCAIAQRLIRKICNSCKTEIEPPADVLNRLGIRSLGGRKVYQGTGCVRCRATGYSGRTAIFEVMSIDQKLREIIAARGTRSELSRAASKNGMRSLLVSGLEKVFAGISTLEEVLRLSEDKPEDLAYCPGCLESVDPDFLVCPHCAHQLKQPAASCHQCHREVRPEWKACPYCGTPRETEVS